MSEGADDRAGKAARKGSAPARPRAGKVDGEAEVLAAIAAMSGSDRSICERLHAIIKADAPVLAPRQSAQKFKTRYSTFGFQQAAKLDDGHMWPVAFALTELAAAEEAMISALVKKAAG
jgi:hypothetical protein